MSYGIAQGLILISVSYVIWNILGHRLFPGVLDNVPGPPSQSWIFGCLKQLVNVEGWAYHKHIAETYGSVIRIPSYFGSNSLYVFDPKALHHILVKDQYIYEETDAFIEANRMILGEGIFTSLGERHRAQRKLLNPVFSIAHMREMVPIFYEITYKMRDTLLQKARKGSQEIDLLAWNTRLALELIGQSGLGYTFDTLSEDAVPHRFAVAAKKLGALSAATVAIATLVIPKIAKIGSARFRRFLVDFVPSEAVKSMRDIVDVLHETSVEIIESKKKALAMGDEVIAAQVGKGKDIMSILLRANMNADEGEKLSDEEMLGQVGSLTFAATDTTSSALSRIFHLLATHKDAQNMLREEIRAAKRKSGGDDLSYDDLVALPYLDVVCRETLRLYAPVPSLARTARQDIILPLSTPIKGVDGRTIEEIPIPKGTNFWIGILHANRNRDLWGPDAEEWKPERWLEPLPEALINAHVPGVYSNLLTFLGGGRSCIGFKFSQLEMKVTLVALLEHLEFDLADKSVVWQMTGIATPHCDFKSMVPSLPMVISLAKSEDPQC